MRFPGGVVSLRDNVGDVFDYLKEHPAAQGIVPIESDSVAEVLEHYMVASEQLDTRLVLAADERPRPHFR